MDSIINKFLDFRREAMNNMAILDYVNENAHDRVYIIAEIGVNHNGSIDLAFESIRAAKQCGANAVKFQTFKSEKLVVSNARKADYQYRNTDTTESQYEMLKKLELNYQDFTLLKQYCKEIEIDFLSTPFDEESADFLYSLNIDAFKISSGDMNNIPFLQQLDQYRLPIILSTGMANLEEVRESVQMIKNSPIILLHCTSDYPAPYEEVNLRAIRTLQQEFRTLVGYSDHTKGTEVSIAAVAMGAKIIEKHFTINKKLPGPDHESSVDPVEFSNLVQSIRNIEKSLGDGVKRCMPSEVSTKIAARKSIVLTRDKRAGEAIRKEDIAIKRPGTGIEPRYNAEVIGKVLVNDMHRDQVLTWGDLE